MCGISPLVWAIEGEMKADGRPFFLRGPRFLLGPTRRRDYSSGVAGVPDEPGPNGKAVKIGRGRAAVTGDDRRNRPLPRCVVEVGRRGGRKTREPENLPATNLVLPSRVNRLPGLLNALLNSPGASACEAAGAFCLAARQLLVPRLSADRPCARAAGRLCRARLNKT